MIDRFHITSWIRRRRAVRRRFNPYIAGTPVFDRQLFFGRETLARRALRIIESRSLALRGGMARLLHGASFAPLLADGSQPLRAVLAGVGRDGVLEELELEPFTPLAAEALVREPVAGVYRYEPRAIELVLEASRLRPFAIQRICRNAVDRMLDDGRTTIRASDVGASGAEARRDVQCR